MQHFPAELRKLLLELAWTPFFPDSFDYSYLSLTATSGVPAAQSSLLTRNSQSPSGGLRVKRNCITSKDTIQDETNAASYFCFVPIFQLLLWQGLFIKRCSWTERLSQARVFFEIWLA